MYTYGFLLIIIEENKLNYLMRKYSRRFAKENCRLLVTRALGCNAVLRDTPKNHGEGQ